MESSQQSSVHESNGVPKESPWWVDTSEHRQVLAGEKESHSHWNNHWKQN